MKQVCSEPRGACWARLVQKTKEYSPGPRTPIVLGALHQAATPTHPWTLLPTANPPYPHLFPGFGTLALHLCVA